MIKQVVAIATAHRYRMLRFAIVGTSGVLVNYLVLYLLAGQIGLNHVIAAAFATEAAIIHNFVLNNQWTFHDLPSGRSWLRRMLRYNVFALGGLLISVTVIAVLTYFGGLHYLFANIFAIGAATLWNYTANYRWTWSPRAEKAYRANGRVPSPDSIPAGDTPHSSLHSHSGDG